MRHQARFLLAPALGALTLVMSASAVRAASGATGFWNRDDGLGGVRIAACGEVLCGHVVWLRDKDSPAFIGQKVLFDMRQTTSDSWSGTAHNPEDGRDYAGTMTLAGDRLVTRGCLFGGLICKSVELTRAK